MKKYFFLIIVIVFSLITFKNTKYTEFYMKECIAIDRKTLISYDGMIWEVKDELETQQQHYIVTFNNNGTNVIIKDDYIIMVKETRN